MIPVPIIMQVQAMWTGRVHVWADDPESWPDYLTYRMVDGDPTNLEVVE